MPHATGPSNLLGTALDRSSLYIILLLTSILHIYNINIYNCVTSFYCI
jgi:hypothetical protein